MATTASSGPHLNPGRAETDALGRGPHTNRDQDTNGQASGSPHAPNGYPASSAQHQQFRSPPGYSRTGSGGSQHSRPPSSSGNNRQQQDADPVQQHQQYLPHHQHSNSNNPYAPYCPPYLQQQYPTAAADKPSAAAAAGMLGQQQQHGGSDTSPLPEAAPAPKTDPVELSLLASYLEVVRQTQGEAAAAEAMAASGLPGNTAAASTGQSPYLAAAAAAGGQQHEAGSAEAPSGSLSSSAPGSAAAANAAAGMYGGSTAAASAEAAEEQIAVSNLLGFIKQRKLTGLPQGLQQQRRNSSSSIGSSSSSGAPGGAAGAAAARKIWIQPSGPRRPGEGVENEEQGILSAEEVPATGEVMMRITLLAAGFVIGPSGASVREVVRLSGADINSWTEAAGTHRGRRPARIFVIKGEPRCIAQAMYVITAAVDRYKELCEGRYTGQSVPRSQNVLGVTFSYQPPPKSIVPCAASLKELYPPAHTTSAAHAAKFGSPPGIYGQAAGRMGMRSSQGARGPAPNPYDPNTWTAMMTAAAAMGMNPLAALAAAGGNPAAAAGMAGYNPLSGFNPFNPAAANFMAGFGQNTMAGLGAGGLDPMNPMQNAMGGLNPMAFGMNPMLGGSGIMGGPGGDMFGPGAALFGGGVAGGATGGGMPGMGGVPVSAAGGVDSPVEGSGSVFGGPWGHGPNMFDPASMPQLMGGGLYGMMGGPGGFDPTAAAVAAAGGGYDPMAAAAMAAAGFDPKMLAAGGAGGDPAAAAAAGEMSGPTGGYGALLNSGQLAMQQQADAAAAPSTVDYGSGSPESSGVSAASKPRRLSRAGSSGSGRAGSSREAAVADADAAAAGGAGGYHNEDAAEAVTPRGPSRRSGSLAAEAGSGGNGSGSAGNTRHKDRAAAAAAGGSSSAPSSGARPPPPTGSWPPAGPPVPFMAGPGPLGSPYFRRGAALPPLMIPTDCSDAAGAGGTSSARDGGHDAPGSPAATAGPSPGAYPPQSPGGPMPLGPFGPLFHPMSPAAPYGMPYGPLPGMPPFVPPSPVRIMRDRSGAAVPYMEVGGTVYFSPASPMPPLVAGMFSPPGGDFHGELQAEAGYQQHQQQGGTDGDAAAGSGSAGAEAAAGRGAGGSKRGAGSSGGSGGRPRSGNTPMRMAAALKLLVDNPYLVQDAIGSGHGSSGHYSHYQGGEPGEQRSGGGSRGYGAYGGSQRGFGARSSPSPRGPQRHMQWQQKRNAGSSNSVGSSGMPAAASGNSGGSRDGAEDGGRSPGGQRKAGSGPAAMGGSSPASGGGNVTDRASTGGAEAPTFDAAAITAALALPGSRSSGDGRNSSSSNSRADVRKSSGKASDPSSSGRDSSPRLSDQAESASGAVDASDSLGPDSSASNCAGDAAARTNAPMGASSSMVGRSPSMTLLSTIPEAAATAGNSPPGAAAGGSSRAGRQVYLQQHQLNAQDPIVSPGRITLASKVKAARLYSSGAARVSGSPGSE